MANLHDVIKRVAFAGLTPGTAGKMPLRERLRRRFHRFADRVAGTPPAMHDPFYESNRNWRQSFKWALYLVTPFLVVLGFVLFSTDLVWHKNQAAPLAIPGKFASDIDIYNEALKASELDVAEIFQEKHTHPIVVHGRVRNNSDQKFDSAEISLNVTDKDGVLLGTVSTTVHDIPPHETREFKVTVPQKDAAIVLVRDARRL